MAVLKNQRISCKARSPLRKSGFSHSGLSVLVLTESVQIDASIFFTSLPATALRPRLSPATGQFKELTPHRPRGEPRPLQRTSLPAAATSSPDRTTLCRAGWEGTISKVPGASARMSQGPSFLHLVLFPAVPALAPATSPPPALRPSALSRGAVPESGVLPSSESFPPQHLRVEDAEHRPGLRRELGRRVLRCSR